MATASSMRANGTTAQNPSCRPSSMLSSTTPAGHARRRTGSDNFDTDGRRVRQQGELAATTRHAGSLHGAASCTRGGGRRRRAVAPRTVLSARSRPRRARSCPASWSDELHPGSLVLGHARPEVGLHLEVVLAVDEDPEGMRLQRRAAGRPVAHAFAPEALDAVADEDHVVRIDALRHLVVALGPEHHVAAGVLVVLAQGLELLHGEGHQRLAAAAGAAGVEVVLGPGLEAGDVGEPEVLVHLLDGPPDHLDVLFLEVPQVALLARPRSTARSRCPGPPCGRRWRPGPRGPCWPPRSRSPPGWWCAARSPRPAG